jgi:hypothetical protein
MTIIKYNNLLIIKNLEQLPHGTGAKYLEVFIDTLHSVLIAYCWRRTMPKLIPLNHAIVKF